MPATLPITIVVKPAPVITPPTLPTISQGVPFTFTFTATGCAATPCVWSEVGSLPAGVTLSSGGVLSGTPSVSGSFPITLQVQ